MSAAGQSGTLPFGGDPDPKDRRAGPPLRLPTAWASVLEPWLERGLLADLGALIREVRSGGTVYPPAGAELRALELTPPEAVRVVLLGQDPYHGPGQAHGLAFSVPPGVPHPPSLQNIFRELRDDLGVPAPESGCLEEWARRGVLLLNTVLTVSDGEAGSHRGRGWESLTDAVVRAVSARDERVVFALWGNPAKAKAPLVRCPPHAIVDAAHPSPLSAHRGFFGRRPFTRINEALQWADREPIDWRL